MTPCLETEPWRSSFWDRSSTQALAIVMTTIHARCLRASLNFDKNAATTGRKTARYAARPVRRHSPPDVGRGARSDVYTDERDGVPLATSSRSAAAARHGSVYLNDARRLRWPHSIPPGVFVKACAASSHAPRADLDGFLDEH